MIALLIIICQIKVNAHSEHFNYDLPMYYPATWWQDEKVLQLNSPWYHPEIGSSYYRRY